MSYEIVYDKQFIKLPNDNFVPLLLWGSNNCTESSPSGKERRARSWSVWSYPCGEGNIWATKEHLLKYCDDFRAKKIKDNEESNARHLANGETSWCDTYSDANFGYWSSISFGQGTHNSTFGQFRGMFRTGCNKALTIEQLRECGVGVSINTYIYDEVKDKEYRSITATSGEHFMEIYEELKEYVKGTAISLHVSVSGMYEGKGKTLRRMYFPRKRKSYKERAEVKQYWTVTVDGSRYFVKKLKYGYQYAGYPYLKYKTEKEAKRRIAKYNSAKYSVELVKESALI